MLTPAQAAAIATSAFVRPAVPPALLAPPSAEEPERALHRTVVQAPESDDPIEAQRRLDASSPGFATAVDLEHEPGTRPTDGLPEVIARTPGATVRSIGGLGQFGAVSLRGSSPQQVAVFLDGVPIGSSLAGLVDLGQIPLDGLARVEIYRGHVPVAFGSAAIGGAIDLVGAPAWQRRGLVLQTGGGSFGARESTVTARGPLSRSGRSAGAITVGYAGATGDFPFADDGGTPDLSGDDQTLRRTGNDYDRVAMHARLDHRAGPWRIAVQPLLSYRDQGVPGPAAAQAHHVRLSTVQARTVASVRRFEVGGPGGRLEWLAGLGLQRQRYLDPEGEVGLAIDDQRLHGLDVYVSPRLRLPLWKDAWLGLVADQRAEFVAVDERAPTVGPSGDARRSRLGVGAGIQLEQFLLHDRWLLVPVLRVDGLSSRFAAPPGGGEQDDQGTDALALGVAPRLGTRLRLWPGIELRASGGRYFRPPTLAELFGDRGYVVGNEGLRPERGHAVDGGLIVDRQRPALDVYAQLAGFATWSEDLISWVSAGAVARPVNVASARVRGLESAVALVPRHRWLTLHANYTWLDSRNGSDDPAQHGQPLPGRPRHELFARVTAGRSLRIRGLRVEPRVLYTVDVIAGTVLDTAGRLELPPRALQGAGAELHLHDRVHLLVEVRNLLDVRTATVTLPVAGARPHLLPIADFIGYPLPGRSVWASVRIELGGRVS
ncbi:TonB-dependent receptor plug domain-containing protein [Paraliomyxa miuraensis]|uniref:TonB-dependent receptor plug domain-containing protein n=1 Tax=Paraliomyxa miuraensis TaxID=376150 RepID=UPI0022502BD7|nr:TonB-dependent receptor [Paraliomyxa miuraensis]MCX4245448.1 TonB-dependent receptor [Paraliomyxa miuraensis]